MLGLLKGLFGALEFRSQDAQPTDGHDMSDRMEGGNHQDGPRSDQRASADGNGPSADDLQPGERNRAGGNAYVTRPTRMRMRMRSSSGLGGRQNGVLNGIGHQNLGQEGRLPYLGEIARGQFAVVTRNVVGAQENVAGFDLGLFAQPVAIVVVVAIPRNRTNMEERGCNLIRIIVIFVVVSHPAKPR